MHLFQPYLHNNNSSCKKKPDFWKPRSITSCNNNGMRYDDDGPNNGPISRVEPTAAATRCVWLRYHRYMALKMDPRCNCWSSMPCGPQKKLQLHFVRSHLRESLSSHLLFEKASYSYTPTIKTTYCSLCTCMPACIKSEQKIITKIKWSNWLIIF